MSETAVALARDEDRLVAVEAELATALEALDAAGRLDAGLLRAAIERLREAASLALERVDQDLARGLGESLAEVALALSAETGAHARFDRVTLALEAARQRLAEHAAGPAVWRSRTPRELVRWLSEALEGVSQSGLAELLGVSPKTVYRWQTGASAAAAGDEDRLRALAGVVAQLRHALTPAGIVAWLRTARAGGATPLERLRRPESLPELVAEAASLRGV